MRRAGRGAVGYRSALPTASPDAWVKVATDGVCSPRRSPTARNSWPATRLIVDEAHERSNLNIDFCSRVPQASSRGATTPRRITSATLDAAHFARHSPAADGPAPVIEVSGRLCLVELRLASGGRRSLDDEATDDEVESRRRSPTAADLLARRALRHPRVPARRARDPRDRRTCCARTSGRRPPGAAAQIVPSRGSRHESSSSAFAPSRSAHRARDQRRRDLLHGAEVPCVIDAGLARVKRDAPQQDDAAQDREDRGRTPTSAPGAAVA